ADAACGALEQAHAQPAFELCQHLAHRRSGDIEFVGGAGEAAVARDRHEGAQGGAVVLGHYPVFLESTCRASAFFLGNARRRLHVVAFTPSRTRTCLSTNTSPSAAPACASAALHWAP